MYLVAVTDLASVRGNRQNQDAPERAPGLRETLLWEGGLGKNRC